ncbi:MAG: DUF4442 domain-containing protein [Ginsengibacter sp.]|jgi:hypothetical protein
MSSFLKIVNHPFKFRLYLLQKLPAAFFSGIRIVECTDEKCVTSVPFKWLTQNPFKSTYFASLSMAAEMSTGALILNFLYERKPAISSLVVKMEALYFKKATGITYFTCVEGKVIKDAVNEAGRSGEGVTVSIKTIGKNKEGDDVAEFLFTWSLKRRSEK